MRMARNAARQAQLIAESRRLRTAIATDGHAVAERFSRIRQTLALARRLLRLGHWLGVLQSRMKA